MDRPWHDRTLHVVRDALGTPRFDALAAGATTEDVEALVREFAAPSET